MFEAITIPPDINDPATVRAWREYLQHVNVTQATADDTDEPFRRWARRRLHIRSKIGRIIPLVLNGVQRRLEAAKRLARIRGRLPRFLVLKYRQGGITTYEQARSYHLIATRPNMQCVTIAHRRESTARIFRIARLMHQKDPLAPSMRGPGNKYQIELPTMNSLFVIDTAGGAGPGRGETLNRVHWSEVAKSLKGPSQVDDQQDLLAGLTEGAAHGEVVLETTADGIELFCHKFREAKQGRNEWTPVFIPWFADPTNRLPVDAEGIEAIMDTLSDRERFLIERHGLDMEQIAWRRVKSKSLGRLFRQEYPEDDESAFLSSGTCYFDDERIISLMEGLPEYPRRHLKGGYLVEWEEPQEGVSYVAGCDTSEGRPNCDPNGVGVLRSDTGAQVAAIHGLFDPSTLAEEGVKLCKRYNNALLGIELENHGHAVLLRVKQLGYTGAQRQLFYRKFIRGRGWRDPGWSTNATTRPVMLQDLADAVEHDEMGVRDRDFLGECLTFRLQGPGRWEADSSCHDDTIFKWGIAWQMRKVRRKRREMRYVKMTQ